MPKLDVVATKQLLAHLSKRAKVLFPILGTMLHTTVPIELTLQRLEELYRRLV